MVAAVDPFFLALCIGGISILVLLLVVLLLLRRVLKSIAESERRTAELNERMVKTLTLLESAEQRGSNDAAQTRDLILGQLSQSREQTGMNLRDLGEKFGDLRSGVERRLGELQSQMMERLMQSTQNMGKDLSSALNQSADQLGKRVEQLTAATDARLKEISGQVDQRLQQGFEKTTSTFGEVIKRLALIDEAQKRITELSTNVVSLQDVLADKRSRGAFGEIQLEVLIKNVLPEQHIKLQHGLPNGSRVDCLLSLPPPTGDICIDAKFPLENYQRLLDPQATDAERTDSGRKFRADVRKHIHDIAKKYILPEITSSGAIMFVPAESVFAEIHARHSDLVREAYDRGVWICSPSTLMAVLTTARAVLRDDALRQQTHLIRNYIIELNREFQRFRERMDKLARHIRQAHEETDKVNTTAKKISRRFESIEQVKTAADQGDAPLLHPVPEETEDDVLPLEQEPCGDHQPD